MSEPTPGQLVQQGRDIYGLRPDPEPSVFIAEADWEDVGDDAARENARRLVACWNVLDGVSTPLLEGLSSDSLSLLRSFAIRIAGKDPRRTP